MAKKSSAKTASKSANKSANKSGGKSGVKTSVKAAGKSGGKKTAGAKSASAKLATKPAAKKTSKKSAPNAAPKAEPTTSKKAAPQASVKKAAAPEAPATSKKKAAGSAVTQVANALKSVASRVTNVFSASPSETDKKKVLKTKPIDLEKAFAPLDDRIVISRDGVSDRTAGGIYIPDSVSAGEKPNRGTVLVAGPGHRDKKGRLRPLDVKPGDTVLFSQWAGSEINIDGREFWVLRESDILAIVNA